MNMKLLTPLSRWFIIVGILFLSSSCFKDLETIPLDKDVITSAVVYNDPKSYRQVLAKLYAGLAVSGQQGPAGQPDISGIDEGFSTYLRQYWKAQELPTEEAKWKLDSVRRCSISVYSPCGMRKRSDR